MIVAELIDLLQSACSKDEVIIRFLVRFPPQSPRVTHFGSVHRVNIIDEAVVLTCSRDESPAD